MLTVKRNDMRGKSEFEKQLRDRMNGLSDSVDCFDKIAARAFPEKSEDFSDSGSTVTDLENISGKRRAAPVLRWISAAAAVGLIFGVLPRTAIMNDIRTNLSGGKRRQYNELVSHIIEETASGDYRVYDLPLGDYVRDDVLVTPMYRCPFNDTDRGGMSVRIFVKMCGDVPTNEMFAVEYSGTYTESNFVAAAATGIKFTEKELEELKNDKNAWKSYSDKELIKAVECNFTSDTAGKLSLLHDGETVSAASFGYQFWYKDENGIQPLIADVLCYTSGTGDKYNYDISVQRADTEDGGGATLPETVWETSLSFDGSKITPDVSNSAFTREELFGGYRQQGSGCAYARCCTDAEDDGIEKLTMKRSLPAETVFTGLTPYDASVKREMRVYVSSAIADEMSPKLQYYTSGSSGGVTPEWYICWQGTERISTYSESKGWTSEKLPSDDSTAQDTVQQRLTR